MARTPVISLIVPTRERPGPLKRLLDSLLATASNPRDLEVVLVIDADDRERIAFCFDGLPLKRVVVRPGQTMGALNQAGYEASTGDYLMLLNDDVIAQSAGWDAIVRDCFAEFPDDILLVHVNDTLFKQALCTFPIVSRTFCRLAGGICPRDYVRYRIDDHIEDVFNLLGILGERRTVYLSEVVFRHCKCALDAQGQENYVLDENILAIDAPRFEVLLPQRKEIALRLKDHIAAGASTRERRLAHSRLDTIQDSFSLRVPGRQRVRSGAGIDYSGDIPVTIGLLTPDSQGRHFRSCLAAIRANTSNYELMILEDQAGPSCSRARALNRLLETAAPGYLVLLEDNIRVGPHWLWDLFRCLRKDVGLVTALPGKPTSPERVMTLFRPLVLLDTAGCRNLFFDEACRSGLAYTDFGLKAWEAGLEVVAAPLPTVNCRRAGPRPLPGLAEELLQRELEVFSSRWLKTGRFKKLEDRVLRNYPEFRSRGSEENILVLQKCLELALNLERQRPAWRQTWVGQLRRGLIQGLWRAWGCWQRGGWRGLARAAGRLRHFLKKSGLPDRGRSLRLTKFP